MDDLQTARQIINEVDSELAALFVRRMEAARLVADYKRAHGLPIFDPVRERAVLERGAARVEDAVLREHYVRFLQGLMDLSKDYQRQLTAGMPASCAGEPRTLKMELGDRSYDITIARGGLARAGRLLELGRKVCIVTDSGVPRQYVQTLADQCGEAVICTLEPGEAHKTPEAVTDICRTMLERGFTRRDCVAAVGGGMVGDLAGFAAASYMRGIDFYNIPTTLLAQVDSSIGGKTGVNLDGVKNILGAFWQPAAVLIDPDTLQALPPRLVAEGLAEYVKMALCLDGQLFRQLEQTDPLARPEELLYNALRLKKQVVEQDEREAGPRKLLNFGHTIGHGVEAAAGGALYHGECVAIGMVPMTGPGLRPRVRALLRRLGLPTETDLDKAAVCRAMEHDKKSTAGGFSAVFVDVPGEGYVKQVSREELEAILEGAWNG